MPGKEIIGPQAWKFYSNSLTKFIHRPFKWPYIDIFFYKENQTHIWDEEFTEYCYPKSSVFPLNKRPFHDMLLYSPCDIRAILDQNYDVDLCRSRQFSHSMEVPLFTFNTRDVPCDRLSDSFPFVYRTPVKGGYNETLKLSNWVLKSHVVKDVCHKTT